MTHEMKSYYEQDHVLEEPGQAHHTQENLIKWLSIRDSALLTKPHHWVKLAPNFSQAR